MQAHATAENPARAGRLPGSWQSWACLVVAVVPLIYIAIQVARWMRNIPDWDEFDSVLDFLIALDDAKSARGVVDLLLAVSNEHRMLVSRLIFAATFGIWGQVNFSAVTVLGNLFILATVALLVARTEGRMPRFRLAAILGAGVFQLQHHESFFWGGSSIDHFFVVLAAVVALAAVITPGRGTLALGCVSGFLATFSLAHGLVVWPLGALFLLGVRRWRAATVWIVAALVTVALFFYGFHFNPGHARPGLVDFPRVIVHWLTLLGSSPALDNIVIAPWFGAILVVGVLWSWRRGIERREHLAAMVVGWCLGSLAMIAWGRALLSDPLAPITSRYMILSSLAWAMFGGCCLERFLARRAVAGVATAVLLVGLVGFDFAANRIHANEGRIHAAKVERAVWIFHRDGTLGTSELLYPDPSRADVLLRAAADHKIYHLPPAATLKLVYAEKVSLRRAKEIADAAYFIEVVENNPPEVWVKGWAFRPAHTIRFGEIAVVFRSADDLVAYKATPMRRPDVGQEYRRSDLNFSGFEVRVLGEHLPKGKLQVGVCFDWDGAPEYMMTSSTVENLRP